MGGKLIDPMVKAPIFHGMGQGGVGVSIEGSSVDDTAHVLIFNPWITLLGQTAYVAITALIYFLYRPVAPQGAMSVWLFVTIAVWSGVACVNLAFVLRRPNKQELLRIWRAIDKRTPILFDLIAALSIWTLFPHGGPELQLVATAFCVGYVPMQMISDPENTFGNRFSIVAVLGSYAAWLWLNGGLTQQILGVMFILYGAVLFVAADAFRKVVVSAVARKEESERSAEALHLAVAEVSAERDAKTRFIASASHDLGQPLQAANLFAGHLVEARNKTERTSAANGLKRAIDSAQRLLGDMLNHMRLEADAVVPQTADIALGAALSAIAAQFFPAARLAGIELSHVLSSLAVRADSSLMDRAIGNLVANAIAHSGSTKILIGARRMSKSHVSVWVIDNGKGITPRDAVRVFDDYFQSRETHESARGGFGLGLASVRRIAQLLGGDAGLDPRWQKGAAFFITLPIAQAGR
jgi:signal transduction histidine kinase